MTDTGTEKKEIDPFQYRKEMMAEAGKVRTPQELADFVTKITNQPHDYNTIVYGCMAAMQAAFKVVNNSPMGGITGFQAGALGWECVREFMMIDGPARIISYNDMLYPQYQHKFEKTITPQTWENLQQEAKKKLETDRNGASDRVVGHWQSVAGGTTPFGYSVVDV